jgi:hypothetical protein
LAWVWSGGIVGQMGDGSPIGAAFAAAAANSARAVSGGDLTGVSMSSHLQFMARRELEILPWRCPGSV